MVDHRNTHPSTPQSMQEAYTSMQPLVRHNASTPYKQDGYGSGGTYIHNSGHSTAYGSPASNTWLGNEYYPQELHQDPYHSHNPVSSYAWNGPDPGYAYPDPDYTVTVNHGRETLPTPAFSEMTRSGSGLARTFHRREKEAKARSQRSRKRKDGKEKNKISLPGPMSEVTKGSKVSVEDTLAFVNRSIDDRKKEVEAKKDKKIPRPMNSFLLYRKAYQERIKEWTDQKNHQKVSEVAAASWQGYESVELKNRYADYAKLERDNHHLAWPNWKFKPKKGPNKRKENESDMGDGDLSDPCDTDPEWAPNTSGKSQTKQVRRIAHGPWAGPSTTSYKAVYPNPFPSHRSAFQAPNPGKLPPAPMNVGNGQGLYYQQVGTPGNHRGIQVEDIRWSQNSAPNTQSVSGPSHVSGLPGAGAALLRLDDFEAGNHDIGSDGQLDPLLLTQEASGAMGSFTDEQFDLLSWNNESQSFGEEPVFPSEHQRDPGGFSDDEFTEYLEGGRR